jgi:hypothetical protein
MLPTLNALQVLIGAALRNCTARPNWRGSPVSHDLISPHPRVGEIISGNSNRIGDFECYDSF